MSTGNAEPHDEGIRISAAAARYKGAFLAVGIFSGLVNVLALTGSLYMLQVYDRVLPSRSVPTLLALTAIMLVLYTGGGVLDLVRTRLMARLGHRIDRALRPRVLGAVLEMPLKGRSAGDGLQPIGDLDRIRAWLSSLGPTALFDVPWLPLYLGLVWLLHPWLGSFAAASMLLLIATALATELRTAGPARAALQSSGERLTFAAAARRNAEVVRAMGLGERVARIYAGLNARHLADQLRAADAASGVGAISKTLRLMLQSAMLGLGAWLAIRGEVSAGTIVAGTIVLGRALAPIELAIAHWRGFAEARQGYRRLQHLLAAMPERAPTMALPRPTRQLLVQGLAVAAPGGTQPIVQGIELRLDAGSGLGIIGPSAAGKSTLARALVGAWAPLPRGGTVRLDGATLDQYSQAALGRDIGYLPQGFELFDATIEANIARLDPEAPAEAVIEAARLAGCHEMILALPEGYRTRIGEGGLMLSAGQRQRVALARALYGNPFLVVLDEPNSNLDSVGDFALAQAIRSVRRRGGIAVVIAHRSSAIATVDLLLALSQGRTQAFGPKDEVLRRLTQAQPSVSAVPRGGGGEALRPAPRLEVVPDPTREQE